MFYVFFTKVYIYLLSFLFFLIFFFSFPKKQQKAKIFSA